MKNNKFPFKTLAVLIAVTLITVMSCKKSSSPSKTELLSRSWKQIALMATSGTLSQDIFATLSACDKDDIYIFSSNGTYQITEGATKCDAADPDVVDAGQWSFLDNETKLRITHASGDPDTLSLLELTSSTLKGTTIDYSLGTPVTVTATFSSQ